MIDCFLGDVFIAFVLLVLEYCSAVWFSAAETHLRLLDRVVSGASFLTGGVFECDLAHRRSVAVLFMLYKIWCNPMHPLYGALPVPYVRVRATRYAVIAALWRSQLGDSLASIADKLWNDLSDPAFDAVGLAGFKSRENAFSLAWLLAHFLSPAVFPFSSVILWVGVVGLGSSD